MFLLLCSLFNQQIYVQLEENCSTDVRVCKTEVHEGIVSCKTLTIRLPPNKSGFTGREDPNETEPRDGVTICKLQPSDALKIENYDLNLKT